jgi:hypothetical protein
MNANYRYNVAISHNMMKAYNLLNKAFGCTMQSYSDEYIADNFKLSMGGNLVYVDFICIDNREYIMNIIDKVAYSLWASPNYNLYDNQDNIEVCLKVQSVSIRKYFKYSTTFYIVSSLRSYMMINKALGFKALRDGSDTDTRTSPAFGTANNYKIVADKSMISLRFANVDDTEYVRGIITMIAEALGDVPEHHFELYDEEDDKDVNI